MGLSAGGEPVSPEPEGPVAKLPTFEEPIEPVDLSPDPLPKGVVAEVDGEPISEAELERLVHASATAMPDVDEGELRRQALLQLVERQLVLANADQMGLLVSDAEIDGALDGIAQTNGLSREQLEDAVVEQGWTLDDYRQELVAQIMEMKVMQVHGLLDSMPGGTEDLDQRRERFVGCMRARAEVQVGDEALTLPDNPYGVPTEIAELRFSGELGLPEDELRSVALDAAKTRMHLCDALSTAELALQELLMERGFLGVEGAAAVAGLVGAARDPRGRGGGRQAAHGGGDLLRPVGGAEEAATGRGGARAARGAVAGQGRDREALGDAGGFA